MNLKAYKITTTTGSETVETQDIDESNPFVMKITLLDGNIRAYGRHHLIAYEETEDTPERRKQREEYLADYSKQVGTNAPTPEP